MAGCSTPASFPYDKESSDSSGYFLDKQPQDTNLLVKDSARNDSKVCDLVGSSDPHHYTHKCSSKDLRGVFNSFKAVAEESLPVCRNTNTEASEAADLKPLKETLSCADDDPYTSAVPTPTIVSSPSSTLVSSKTGVVMPNSTANVVLNCNSLDFGILTMTNHGFPILTQASENLHNGIVGGINCGTTSTPVCMYNRDAEASTLRVNTDGSGQSNSSPKYFNVGEPKTTEFKFNTYLSDEKEMPDFATVILPYNSATDVYQAEVRRWQEIYGTNMPEAKKIRLQHYPGSNTEILSKCEMCGSEVVNSYYFNGKRTHCEKCDSAIKRAVLLQHVTDASTSYSCNSVLKTEIGVKEYTLNSPVDRPYECTECGAKFARKGHLATHNLLHTGERPYTCKVCSASFTHMTSLKDHVLQHTGEKPYKCGECGAAFARKGHLNTHTLIHTGKTPYQCDVCGASFTHKTSLKDHTLQHTGEKPYQCAECGAAFRRKGHLNTHNVIHMREKLFQNTQYSVEKTQNFIESTHNSAENTQSSTQNTESSAEKTHSSLDKQSGADNMHSSVDNTRSSVGKMRSDVDNTQSSVGNTQRSVDNTQRSVDNTQRSVGNTQRSVDKHCSVDNTQSSGDNTWTSVDKIQTSVENAQTSVENAQTSIENAPFSVEINVEYAKSSLDITQNFADNAELQSDK